MQARRDWMQRTSLGRGLLSHLTALLPDGARFKMSLTGIQSPQHTVLDRAQIPRILID